MTKPPRFPRPVEGAAFLGQHGDVDLYAFALSDPERPQLIAVRGPGSGQRSSYTVPDPSDARANPRLWVRAAWARWVAQRKARGS